jgi:hypothetical protein
LSNSSIFMIYHSLIIGWVEPDPETGFLKQTRFLKPLSFLNKKLGVAFYHRLLTYLNPPALKIL